MGNKFKHMKQVLTAVLTVAMIFTSVPTNVLAAELENDILSDVITEADDSQAVIEEAADVITDKSTPVSNSKDEKEDTAVVERDGDPEHNIISVILVGCETVSGGNIAGDGNVKYLEVSGNDITVSASGIKEGKYFDAILEAKSYKSIEQYFVYTLSKSLISGNMAEKITFNLKDLQEDVDLGDISVITIKVRESAKSLLTFSGDGNETFTSADGSVDYSEYRVYKGLPFEFKVEPNRRFRIKSVSVDGTALSANEGVYSYTPPVDKGNHTITADAEVADFKVYFTGGFNASVNYEIEDGDSGTVSSGDYVPVIVSHELEFEITPFDHYKVSSVIVDNKPYELNDNNKYEIKVIDSDVTVEIKTETKKTSISINSISANNPIFGVRASYTLDEAPYSSQSKGADENHSVKFDVDEGSALEFTAIVRNPYDIVTAIYCDDVKVSESANLVIESAFEDNMTFDVETGNLEKPELADGVMYVGITPTSTVYPVEGSTYVYPYEDFIFKATSTSANRVVNSVSYMIGNEEEPLLPVADDTYEIPNEVIVNAIKTGQTITLNATTTSKTRTINVGATSWNKINKIEVQEATVAYSEGKPSAYTKIGASKELEKGKVSVNEVNTNNALAITVTPETGKILTGKSVLVDGKPLSANTVAGAVGDYVVIADQDPEKIKSVSITAYDPVRLSENKAENLDGLTKITTFRGITPAGALDDTGADLDLNGHKVQDIGFQLDYESGKTDYDAILARPTVKAGNEPLKVDYKETKDTNTHTGKKYVSSITCTISAAEVEKAVEAGKDIVITDNSTAKAKNNLSFVLPKSDYQNDITAIYISEFDALDNPVNDRPINVFTTVSGDKVATVEVQEGNYLVVDDITYSEGSQYDFVRISVDGTPAGSERKLYNLKDKSKVVFDVARLKTSEIAYDPGKNVTKTVSSNYEPMDSSSEFVSNVSTWKFNVNLVEANENEDINKYVVNNVKYAVIGNTAVAAKLYSDEDEPYYYIPIPDLQAAAFAEAVNGKKLTISSDIKKDGYKKQELSLYADPTDKASLKDVKENKAAVVVDYALSKAEITYNAKNVTGSVSPSLGNKLDRVYVIRNADIKSASVNIVGMEPSEVVTTLLAKIDLSKNALPATKLAVDDKTGKASFNISKMDGGYTVIASLKEAAEVYVYPYMVSDAMFSRDDKGVYHVGWNCSYNINYVKGNSSNTLQLSSNTISANCGGEDVTAAVLGDVSGDPSTINFDPASVAGKTVTVTFADKEGTAGKQAVTFAVSAKPEIKFSAGTVSEGKISKPQQLGVYDVEYPVTITGGDVVAMVTSTTCGSSSETWSSIYSDCPAYAEVVANKNKSNKVTGYKLLVSSIAYKDGYNTLSEATITFYDESLLTFDSSGYPNSNAKIGEVTVQFTTAQVTGAVLKGITTTGNSDSITLNFKDVKGDFVKNTNGLYYHVKVTTSQNDIQLEKTWEGDIPASTTSYTVKLAKDDDTVQPDPVTYKVEVTLVQKYENANIAESTAKEELSETTIADKDSIYATKVKLKKNSAVKTIYGGKTNGMGWFQLATVTYPAPKNVTVQRVKKVELYKGGELICDVAAGGSNKFIKEEQNIISLRTVYPYDDEGKTKYKGLEPGKYSVVAYAVEPMGNDVAGKYNFTVEQAIEKLDVTVPSYTRYVDAGKKATIKASVVYNDGDKKVKPKTKKVRWSVKCNDSQILPAGVTFKNGTITVTKNTNIPAGGWSFHIFAQAADFAGNEIENSNNVTIMPMKAASTPAQIKIGDTLITTAGGNFRSDQVNGEMSVFGSDLTKFEDVSIKVSGALKSYTDDGKTYCYAVKTGKAKIKVSTTDGSKKSHTFNIKVVVDAGINGKLFNYGVGMIKQFDSSSATYKAENNYAVAQPIYLSVYGDNKGLINASIKVKGFKKLKNDSIVTDYEKLGMKVFKLQPTKRSASITINGKTVINVTNTAFPEVGKKIKITQKKGAKIYNYLNYFNLTSYNQVSPNNITYTVVGGKEGDHVRIYVTKDTANGDIVGILETQAVSCNDLTDNHDGTFTATLGKAGTFAIDYVGANGKINIKKGTYKLQMTPVDEDNKAVGNSVTLNLKVVKTPKISVSLKTLKINFASGTLSANQQLVIKTQKNVIPGSVEFGNKDVPKKNLLGFNTMGKINKFHEMFTLDTDGKLTYTGKLDPNYNAKKGINGWAAVTYTGIDGVQRTDYFKLTVKGAFVSSN